MTRDEYQGVFQPLFFLYFFIERGRERGREGEREREGESGRERKFIFWRGTGLCRASLEHTKMAMGYKGFKAKPIVRYWPIMVRQEL